MTHRLAPKAKEATIGELAARSGVAPSALRFYEAEGLIKSRRTPGNQRRYSRDTLRRVAFIRTSQQLGMPLATIREVLALLPEDRTPNRADWARISACWREDLDTRIRTLQRMRDNLTDCIGCGCLSLSRCSLSNTWDELGARGPGPRRLVEEQIPCATGSCGAASESTSGSGEATPSETQENQENRENHEDVSV
ncbi:redox-sensitive transcriptional activator SoxR [Streptomyces atriruber]|uniref:redox-sensitive transcriptional activator SoxR n=1 Tax=Streptomyces atriruber TaxID=545121 RepID=UPI0006E3FDE0|nr:redox-sensitive transcriptional activator SoxR [Streptomyces atriruber]